MRQSLRSLLKNPGFSVLVTGVLALGIGANTALFSIIDRVLLNPFPYREPDRLVYVSGRNAKGRPSGASPAEFRFWEGRVPAFQQSAIWRWRELMLTGVDDPESLMALEVSPHTFDILGVPPAHGRLFQPGDFRQDSAPVVIIGYRFWQRHFKGDPTLVGRQILLDQQGYTVVGIMAPEFMFHRPGFEVWVPLNPFHSSKEELKHWFSAMARLRPGATIEQAQRQMDSLTPLMPTSPGESSGWRAILRPYADEYIGEYRRALYVLWGAVVLVLLIACANAANLLLARASNRKREFAVRASLGAGRWRLAGQQVIESLMLAVGAGAAGVLLATLMLRLLLVAFPEPVAFLRPEKLSLTGSALAVTLGAVFATTILCSIPGCLEMWRSDLSAALHASSRTMSSDRVAKNTRAVLVAIEFALSVALLIGAGLMIQSLFQMLQVPIGLKPDHVLTARVGAPSQLKDKERLVSYFDGVLDQLSSIPGTRCAGIVTVLPMSNLLATTSFAAEGQSHYSDEPDSQTYSVALRSVSPRYFETMGTRVLRGRAFDGRDTGRSPGVAIVNEELARHYWPAQDPIGKRVSQSRVSKADEWLTVVGVIENGGRKPMGELYRPFTQDTTAARATSVVVRTNGDPLTIASVLRKRIHALNPDQPVTEVRTMESWVREGIAQPRFNTALLEVFAGLAFVLAVSGVFAVVSYAVTQRTHEIGIRSALGATTRDIGMFVVRIGMGPVLAGTGIGVAGAMWGARFLQSQLFETRTLDPTVFAVVIPLLLGAAFIAALLPARRAVHIDPAVTLRSE